MATRNQITVKLGKVQLSAEQRRKIQLAMHEAFVKELKVPADPPDTDVPDVRETSLIVRFLHANPGLSRLTARHKGADQTITSSGRISFPSVASGDTISVRGVSVGTSVITIDRSANPASMTFDPGEAIAGIFLIK